MLTTNWAPVSQLCHINDPDTTHCHIHEFWGLPLLSGTAWCRGLCMCVCERETGREFAYACVRECVGAGNNGWSLYTAIFQFVLLYSWKAVAALMAWFLWHVFFFFSSLFQIHCYGKKKSARWFKSLWTSVVENHLSLCYIRWTRAMQKRYVKKQTCDQVAHVKLSAAKGNLKWAALLGNIEWDDTSPGEMCVCGAVWTG